MFDGVEQSLGTFGTIQFCHLLGVGDLPAGRWSTPPRDPRLAPTVLDSPGSSVFRISIASPCIPLQHFANSPTMHQVLGVPYRAWKSTANLQIYERTQDRNLSIVWNM